MSFDNLKNHWREFKSYDATVSLIPEYSPPSAARGGSMTYRYNYDKSSPIPHTLDATWSEIFLTGGVYMFLNGLISAILFLVLAEKRPIASALIFATYTAISGLGIVSHSIKECMEAQASSYHSANRSDANWMESFGRPAVRATHVCELPRFSQLLFSKSE